MTELEKIAYAKSFIDKLANGVNPIDNSIIPEGDIVNNVRLSRCFFYVSDVLRQVIENGGIASTYPTREKKPKKQPYTITSEQAAMFEYSTTPIPSSEIFKRIMEVGPQEGVKKFPKRNLTKWLISIDLIEEIEVNGNKQKRPTVSGEEIGISLEERQGQYGAYFVLLYNIEAQHFIIDNIDALLAFDSGEYKEKMNLNNQGKPWDALQDEKLIELYNEGVPLKDIAVVLKRSEKAISIRLANKGFVIDNRTEISESKISNSTVDIVEEQASQTIRTALTCQSCRFARSGECFPQKEICKDYEKAYDIPQGEREAWPEMGDASYLRQKGRRR